MSNENTDDCCDLASAIGGVIDRMKAENAKLRDALLCIRSDHQCTLDQYNANGPMWTSRDSGAEYYSASYVLAAATETIAKIDEALS